MKLEASLLQLNRFTFKMFMTYLCLDRYHEHSGGMWICVCPEKRTDTHKTHTHTHTLFPVFTRHIDAHVETQVFGSSRPAAATLRRRHGGMAPQTRSSMSTRSANPSLFGSAGHAGHHVLDCTQRSTLSATPSLLEKHKR